MITQPPAHAVHRSDLRFVGAARGRRRRTRRGRARRCRPSPAGEDRPLVQLPDELRHGRRAGETWLTVRRRAGRRRSPGRRPGTWSPGAVRADGPDRGSLRRVALARRAADRRRRAGRRRSPSGPATFDAGTGRLRRLYGLPVDGPRLELWRAPTDNDRSDIARLVRAGGRRRTPRGEGAPGPSSERALAGARAGPAGTPGTRASAAIGDQLVVRVAVVGGQQRAVRRRRLPLVAGRRRLGAAGRGHPVHRLGLHLAAGRRTVRPAGRRSTRRRWFGTGPLESYPDTRRAARVGRFAAGIDELDVSYSRPQETGHRAGAALAGARRRRRRTAPAWRPGRGPGGHRPGFTLTRHTPQELDRARHPYELPDERPHLSVPRRRGARRRLPRLRDRRAAAARALAERPGVLVRLLTDSASLAGVVEGARAGRRRGPSP